MKIKNLVLLIAFCLVSCNNQTEKDDPVSMPAVAVTLTHVVYGNISSDIVLSATTAYLSKSVVAAPIAGYIIKTYVQAGDKVKSGEPLYELESKEQHTLSSAGMPPITVCAGQDGILLDVFRQKGDYVPEGTELCTLADSGSLVFLLNVPYEFSGFVAPGAVCTLELSDETHLRATVGGPLASMDTFSQTQPVVAHADVSFLPEGMHAKAVIRTDEKGLHMLLPKGAVQSDESLSSHWVMKLLSDSMAVRVPVKTGDSRNGSIEVEGPLSPDDRIVLTGGYALPDSSKIIVSHE
ncbi:efflux RND transporter periplasmic adaptor subunit [Bacteroides gallinaceum]|uniref:HlyD family efflux transporter periplasmic adaptor subunit n=1 Tax=Bacteroides gallinaceum TaxID=1462571 RepID=A0ABT7VIS9_9BACE|nr:hypothetical protein [Bacteroides gallinaceum]MDM8326214.1 hypothetical protein [Bacteroides gallinaceum]